MLIPAGLNFGAADAMASPHLFGPFFAGPSWDTWKTVVKGAFAEPMVGAERERFIELAKRQPPARRVRELVCAIGRGGGKDSVASFLAAYVAVTFDPRGKLRPGEKATIVCLATDRSQAAIVFNYLKGYLEAVPALKALVVELGRETIELSNGVVIEIRTNSFRGIRGKTLLCAIFDEAAFWRDENSASPDVEMDIAVGPGLARMQGALKIIISSVHKRSGLLYSKVREYHGKDDPNVLVVMGPTLTFNPGFDAALIERDLASDPERFGAEYLCRWRDDLASFITRDLLDACTDKGVTVRPPQDGISYVAACDVSGGRNDAFTAAIAHREKDNRIVLDVAFERLAPFNPSDVVDEVVTLMKEYRCHSITGDNFGAAWTVESFAKAGAEYLKSERDRSAAYMDSLPLFTSGRARLLDNSKLISQFAALERRTFATGRERIDPGPGHDDLANSAAIALSLVAAKKGPMIITDEFLALSADPNNYRPNISGYGGWGGRMPLTYEEQKRRNIS